MKTTDHPEVEPEESCICEEPVLEWEGSLYCGRCGGALHDD